MELTLDHFKDWLEGYFSAWKTNDMQAVGKLFAEDAVLYSGPFAEPIIGRQPIVEAWILNPASDGLKYSYAPIAIHEDTGAAHWNVRSPSSSKPDAMHEYDGILVIKFDEQGQCIEHKEWFLHREV
jgi:ketosteroid isomerase-like protein